MCVYAEQCMQWCDRINEWMTDWLAGCICSKYMCIIILRSMYSKYVCLCSVHIHITTRPESMTHCSCSFLVHFIYFAKEFQCDLPITCTNCILKLIYCHNGMRDETLIQPIHCCRSQRVGAAIAIILFFRLRLFFFAPAMQTAETTNGPNSSFQRKANSSYIKNNHLSCKYSWMTAIANRPIL